MIDLDLINLCKHIFDKVKIYQNISYNYQLLIIF